MSGRGPNRFLRFLDRWFCRTWHRLPSMQHRLPDGPVILVGNHRCGLDPLLVQASVDRPLCFLMAREYYEGMWYLHWLFRLVGAIPVQPGGANRHALREAIEVVREGNALCLFPEGEANPSIPLRRILPGAAILARETGAPIVPFRISGVWPFDHVHVWRPFLRRSKARIRFGQPFLLEGKPGEAYTRDSLRRDVERIRQAIRSIPHPGSPRHS